MYYMKILLNLFAVSILLKHAEPSKHFHLHPQKRSHSRKHYNPSANGEKVFKRVRVTNATQHSSYSSAACIIKIDHKGMMSFQGGAVLVSDYWAVTGAQVMLGFAGIDNVRKVGYVFANGENWIHPNEGIYRISKYFIFDKFKSNLDYDIAAVKVKDLFVFKGLRFPAIPYRKEYAAGLLANVAVWEISSPGNISEVYATLHQHQVELADFGDCQRIYKSTGQDLTGQMLCAHNNIRSTCASEAGGPLYLKDELIGIISWGAPGKCGNSIYPDVYTKVTVFRGWLGDLILKN